MRIRLRGLSKCSRNLDSYILDKANNSKKTLVILQLESNFPSSSSPICERELSFLRTPGFVYLSFLLAYYCGEGNYGLLL